MTDELTAGLAESIQRMTAELDAAHARIATLLDDQFHDKGFVRPPNEHEVLYSHHYTDAVQALTARQAYAKSECAMLIAEQSLRAEKAETERDELKRQLTAVGWE